MKFTKQFTEFVETCKANNQYVGLGNPNAHILIIGKEATPNEGFGPNALSWSALIDGVGTQEFNLLEYVVDENNKDHKKLYQGWGKNTWSKYQALIDKLRCKATRKYYVDFLTDVFATEMNNTQSETTQSANKDSLATRKKMLKKSAFIKSFPVVILACSNYISNTGKMCEIDEMFDVSYDGDDKGKYIYNSSNWFYTHHNADRTTLVIHTRQLSADVKNEMLDEMADIIRLHLANTQKLEL